MLANALRYWDREPHRFICITDEKKGFNPLVEVMPLPSAAKAMTKIPAPQGKQFPSSYRRMWCFSEEARVLGDKIILLDVDCLIAGDLSKLWAAEGDFVGWKPMTIWGREDRIGGGTWMLETGKLAWLWELFASNPVALIEETKAKGWTGSDQAIMSRFLHNKYPQWPQRCGIYGSQDGVFIWDLPPKDAVIIHFNGDEKPWGLNKLWIRALCNFYRSYNATQS